MNDSERRQRVRRARALFDQITGAAYFGYHFREVLFADDEALAAAQTLVDRLRANGVRGMD